MTTSSPNSMKLHLLILVSLFNLSSGFMAMADLREPLSDLLLLHSAYSLSVGFMAEVRGPCTEETCTIEEYAEEAYYNSCAAATLVGADSEADPTLPERAEIEQKAFVNRGGEGQQSGGGWMRSGVPRATSFVERHIPEEGTCRRTIRVYVEFPSLPPFFQHGRLFARSKVLTTRASMDLCKLFSKRLSKAIFVLLLARLYFFNQGASRDHPVPHSRPSIIGNSSKHPEL
jgi:hypothetical protein